MAAETEIERLIVRLIGDASSYQKMMKDAEAQAKKTAALIENRLRKVGDVMTKVGRSMTLKITAPLAVIGGAAVKTFSDFDKAMVESTSIMKVTTDQIDQMREAAVNLSAGGEVLQGPKQLAESYFFLASAGKDAAQSMALLPKVAAFATAGAFDMALATDLLTDAQSALGLSSKNVIEDTRNLVRVSDTLVKANTLANASVQQFSTALTSKSGAALKSYGKDVEEGVAVLAALADQGVKAELAGNALDRVIRLSSKGALDNAKAHQKLGFQVFDNAGKMRNLGDIIANLEDVLEGLSDEQRAATLDMLGFEARVQGVILPLLGTSDAIKKYEAELRKAKGTTQEVADKQMKSFSAQMTILKNQVTAASIEIGQKLAPVVKAMGSLVASTANAWRGMNSVVQDVIITLALLLGAVGPMLIVLGNLLRVIASAITGFKLLKTNALAARAALASFGTLVIAGILITAADALADINAELDITAKRVERLRGIRLQNLLAIEDPKERKKAIGEELGFRQRELAQANQALRSAEKAVSVALSKGSQDISGGITRASESVVQARKDIKIAEKQLAVFNQTVEEDSKKRAIKSQKESLGLEGGGPTALNTLVGEGLLRGIDLLQQGAKAAEDAMDDLSDAIERQKERVKERNKQLEEAKRITEANRTPLQKLQDELERLLSLKEFLDPETFQRAAQKAQEAFEKATQDKPILARVNFQRATPAAFGSAESISRREEFLSLRGDKSEEEKNTKEITDRLDLINESINAQGLDEFAASDFAGVV